MDGTMDPFCVKTLLKTAKFLEDGFRVSVGVAEKLIQLRSPGLNKVSCTCQKYENFQETSKESRFLKSIFYGIK